MATTKPKTLPEGSPVAVPPPPPAAESQTITSADIGSLSAVLGVPSGAAPTSEAAPTPPAAPPSAPASQEAPAAGGAGAGNDHLVPIGAVRSDGQMQTPELLGQATDMWMAAQAAAAATPLPNDPPPVPLEPDESAPPLELTIAEPVPEGEVRVPAGFLESTDTRTPGTAGRHVTTDETVDCYAPRAFTLTLDDGTGVPFKAGRNDGVSLAHATHWYAAANGVRPLRSSEE